MLNRKASNYIFYGMLVAIALIVFLVRSVMIGNVNGNIEEVQNASRLLQNQIDMVYEIVAENRDIQENHLYELYNMVPENYNDDILINYIVAQLELIGVTAANELDRDIDINTEVTFPEDSVYRDLQEDFDIIEVQVYFNTDNLEQVEAFIDIIHNSEQVFIVSFIKYNEPDGVNLIGVEIHFLAFYAK